MIAQILFMWCKVFQQFLELLSQLLVTYFKITSFLSPIGSGGMDK